MDNPKTVHDLLALFELALDDLQLCCVYCMCALTRRELILFDYRTLFLVWRKGIPYAVCDPCLRGAAKIQLWRYFERSVSVSTFEFETGTPLGDADVRCAGCCKYLGEEEKLLMVEENRRVHQIGDKWRGVCIRCRQGFRR
ncbi:E6 [Leptonychotes weddellii papillomavirus 6]|uniref:Protein E6 n=1 Tax=Leptonychotes weddellii papillomavirus 6 TaxID=2077307 RepID=A0A2I8B2P8_9PAPI|nr:E6 [Leptonychotes weddellii papillomavirus 6]AUT11901.1 E6 [Leptonychotes weddellii papillomavirus 6]WJJ59319.1 MAG: E6 protein [Leptonychotes weddellii papillomavirus 6]WJJ59324.1 MAG: E6 protein [Leptonychotes weddellii papillomavirus 6]